ncbi:MAG: DUF4834 family protein [Alistipes sp.]|nr:DUF4834 family protein [Alistipes sp.]
MILTVLLSIFVIIYLTGLLGRILFSYWIRKKQREMGLDPSGGFSWGVRGSRERPRTQAEGDITVQKAQTQAKKINKNVGDYVDYEEVK